MIKGRSQDGPRGSSGVVQQSKGMLMHKEKAAKWFRKSAEQKGMPLHKK
jgi:hypothetical protein